MLEHGTGLENDQKVSMKTITNGDALRLVLDALEVEAQIEKRARANKIRLIRAGKALGAPWRPFAEKLEVTEPAVIRLMQRADAKAGDAA